MSWINVIAKYGDCTERGMVSFACRNELFRVEVGRVQLQGRKILDLIFQRLRIALDVAYAIIDTSRVLTLCAFYFALCNVMELLGPT